MTPLKSPALFLALIFAALMALTRVDHFGSAISLPDASYALFLLGGLYLGRAPGTYRLLALFLCEAMALDAYAVTFGGTSNWCITPAYGFLLLAYAGLWLAGQRLAPYARGSLKDMTVLLGLSGVAGSLAFAVSNVGFYLFSGYFNSLSALEYADRVSAYLPSYAGIMLLYIGLALLIGQIVRMATSAPRKAAG